MGRTDTRHLLPTRHAGPHVPNRSPACPVKRGMQHRCAILLLGLLPWLPVNGICQEPPAAAKAPLVQVVGTVTDSLTGKPVYDCLVGYYTTDGKRRAVTPVNADGLYALFVAAGQPFELRVELENGYLDRRRTVPPIPPGTTSFRQDLALMPKKY